MALILAKRDFNDIIKTTEQAAQNKDMFKPYIY